MVNDMDERRELSCIAGDEIKDALGYQAVM